MEGRQSIVAMFSQDLESLGFIQKEIGQFPKPLHIEDIYNVRSRSMSGVYEIFFEYKDIPGVVFRINFMNAELVTWGYEMKKNSAHNDKGSYQLANDWIGYYKKRLVEFFKESCIFTKLPILMQNAKVVV